MYWRAFQELVPDELGKPRFLEPSEIVALGGDVIAGGTFTGIPNDVPRSRQLRDDMAEARRLAARRGVDLRLHVTVRPDHYVELAGADIVPGFNEEWIFRTTREKYENDLRRFESKGWSVDVADFVSKTFIYRERSLRSDAPHFYGPVFPAKRRYEINGVLVDMRNPDYRRWQLDFLESFVKFTGADGVAVILKTGWYAPPMHYPKASPDGQWGGPLSDTPYGAGEYERAVTAWVGEAKARGLKIYLQDSTPGAGGPGAWYTPELEAAVAGHFKPIPLVGNPEVQRVMRAGGS